MGAKFKRDVDQKTQNVIVLLDIWKIQTKDQSYRSVKIEKSRRVVESRPLCLDLNCS
jgi:hypothetical protein